MRFIDPTANDFIFKDTYAKDVPADGWAFYAERIWVSGWTLCRKDLPDLSPLQSWMQQTIQESKDLDLPTQKEMLAMFRCDELMETSYRSFTAALEPIRQRLGKPEGSFVSAFGDIVTKAQTEAISA